jgi:hypothetical protein
MRPKHTEGSSETGVELHLSALGGCPRHDLRRPDECDVLIGDGSPTSDSHGILETRPDQRTVIHQVWHVDRALPFACRRAEWGKDEHRWPRWDAKEDNRGKARDDDEVDPLSSLRTQEVPQRLMGITGQFHSGRDPRDLT